MATLRAVAQPFDCPLPHTLLAYWRGLLERFRRRGNYGRKVLRLLGEQASWTSFLSHMWADKHLRAKRQCSSDYRLPLCFPNPSVQLRLMHQLRIFYFLRRTDNRLATQPGSFG